MKKILCIFFGYLILSGFCFSDETYDNISFDFKSSGSFPIGNFKTFAEASSGFLQVFSGLETEKFSKIKKPNNIKFIVNSCGLRFSPLLIQDGRNFKPCLSFYFGKLNYSSNFKKLISNNFSNPKYGKNISIQKNGNINLSKSGLESDFGFEFALKHFEVDYVASKNKKLDAFNHAVFFNFNGKDLTIDKHDFFTSSYLGFSPSTLKPKTAKLDHEKNKYNLIFGNSLKYINDYVGLAGDFTLSKNTEKKIAYSASFNVQNFWEILNINVGISANTKNFIGWKNTCPKNTLSFYLSPKFSYGIFSLQTFYNLEKLGLIRKEQGIKGEEKLIHKGGGKIEVKNKHFKVLTSLEYASKTFSGYFLAALYFPRIQWFKKLEVKVNADITSKNINPYAIQKYGFNCKLDLLPIKNFYLSTNFLYKQENKNKKRKIDGIVTPVIEWQAHKIEGSLKLKYTHSTKKAKNNFSLTLKFFNQKPNYNISLEYWVKI